MKLFRRKQDPYYNLLVRIKTMNVPIIHLSEGDSLEMFPDGTWPLFWNPEKDIMFRYVCSNAEWSCEMAITPEGRIKPTDRNNIWNQNIRPYLMVKSQ